MLPVPLHGEQNYFIFFPSPPQDGQFVCMTIIPWRIDLNPDPLQELQVVGEVPALALVPLQDEHMLYFLN